MNRPALALLIVTTLSSPSASLAQAPSNPFDARQREFGRDAERRGRTPEGILPLLRINGHAADAQPAVTRAVLDRLRTSRRLSAPNRAYAEMLHAEMLLWAGDATAAADAYDALGFAQRFRVIGPFDNVGRAGFARELGPEAARNQPTDLEVAYEGSQRPVRWRTLPDEHRFGWVDLSAFSRPAVEACGFAETFVRSERAQTGSVWVGNAGAIKVYVNGELIITDEVPRSGDYDRHAASVALRAGWNRVLVKVCNEEGPWGFSLRFADPRGAPLTGLAYDPAGATEAAPAPARAPRLPRGPTTTLAALEERVTRRPDDAQALFELAFFLAATSADDPAEQPARQHADRACSIAPNAERCLFAASLVEQRAEVMRLFAAAQAASPDDPRVTLMPAVLAASGPDSERALTLLSQVPAGTAEALAARPIRAAMLRGLGLQESARGELEGALADAGDTPRLLSAYVDTIASLGHAEEAMALRQRYLRIRWDDVETRRALIADALRRGEIETVRTHLSALRAATADDASFHYYAASIFDGLGREDESLREYRAIIALAPDEPDAHVALGRALLRFDQPDAAAASLRTALALSPQDAATRELLEDLRPTERPDEALATATEELLRRRSDGEGWSASVLHDLRVKSVYDNGLGSSYRQLAVQVHDQQGADRYRTHSIRYEPGTQWVDIRLARVYRADGTVRESVGRGSRSLADHRYRIYYDTRALIIEMPELSPGDTVELRYRVDDVARRNIFDDYFGDFQVLAGFDPIHRLEYVLRSPRSRELHFNAPAMARLTHERAIDADQQTDRFVARDIPALRAERGMPGITEVAPYLHVSTYRSWEDVGRWWWGLVQDQLVPDADIRQTVEELMAGAGDTEDKVRRIYHWVVSNTRYVGLEFGIHGFKPYRVTQVVRRGYGDCKDKASLLYAMLTLAGIDARIALTRTRRNGAIAEAPASLAIFDHAIAYVPALDLYLDGTAEYSGAAELPGGDQGVTVLVVGPNDARLVTTPELPANRQRRELDLDLTIAGDGSALLSGAEIIASPSAGSYRSSYEAEHTRTERLQRTLANSFPGVELVDQTFEDMSDFDAPVRFRYQARVPQMAQPGDGGLRVAPSNLGDLTASLARTPTRRHPLELGTRSQYTERRIVRPARGVRITRVPEGGEVRSPFGHLTLRFEQNGNAVTATTELVLTRTRVPANEYTDFRAFITEADSLLRQRVELRGAP